MTKRIFRVIGQHGAEMSDAIALRSHGRSIDYQTLAGFLTASIDVLENAPSVVGIASADPLDAALADLALSYRGKVVVHLPPFLSAEQQNHIINAAGIGAVIGGPTDTVNAIRLPDPQACPPLTGPMPEAAGGSRRVIFTSGSSGQPKGVVIGEAQMNAAVAGLAGAIVPVQSDVHLSLMPMAQLLEQIAGLYLPLLTGAQVCFCPEALPALFGGPLEPVFETAFAARPTTTILVPAMLARIVARLEKTGMTAPPSLRFVAVGGAATSGDLIARAEKIGLPVFEGYGLSECSSVVALNRPGDTKPGTVGRVLRGLNVRIDDGEIIVSGPTVMDGYLGEPTVTGEWRTGDLGRFENGRLVVEGRKDWLIVTPEGRNINPEWVEAQLASDPRIAAAGLRLAEDGRLEIITVITAPMQQDEAARALCDLPAYARPSRIFFVPASVKGLLKPGGGIDRSQLADLAAQFPGQPLNYEHKECVA